MAIRYGKLTTNFTNNGVVDTGIILASSEHPTKISACETNATFRGSGTKAVMHLYFCNQTGTNIVDILSFTSNNGYQYTFMGPNAPDLHSKNLGNLSGITNLNGAHIYLKAYTSTGSGTYTGAANAEITLETNLSCSGNGAPTSVTIDRDGPNKLKVTWSGATAGSGNSISGYQIVLSTTSGGSAAFSYDLTSTATSGSYTFTTNNATAYYAGVKTLSGISRYYNSTYKWSSTSKGAATKCGAPSTVNVDRTKGTVTITWSGATAGNNNAISNYGVLRNTSASATNATTVSTGASSGITNAPGQGTFYYGVRTQGAAGSDFYSDYKWSGAISVPAKPSVTAGNTIYKTDMDKLKTWLNGSQTSVTQNATITETVGDTYGNVTAGNSITAAWYNGLT